MSNFNYYRKMLNVQRLSGTFKHRSYNLMEHSYGVTMLFIKFAEEEGINITVNDIKCVLNHEVNEVITSDLPWPVKNFNQLTKDAWNKIEHEVTNNTELQTYSDSNIKMLLDKEKYALFKYCDIIDLMLFCAEEIEIGNNTRDIKLVLRNCNDILRKLEYPILSADAFVEELKERINIGNKYV